MKDYIVTVMARDRVGIVRDVSTALAGLGGNITNVSQTVMRNYFTLILSLEAPDERTQLEIRQAVERSGGVGELEVNVRPFEESAPGENSHCESFTLSLQGADRPGIISKVTTHLAQRGVNIDDFYAFSRDGRFVMLLQISIPCTVDVDALQGEIEPIGAEHGVVVHLQHRNIFRATSEIIPVMDLEREANNGA